MWPGVAWCGSNVNQYTHILTQIFYVTMYRGGEGAARLYIHDVRVYILKCYESLCVSIVTLEACGESLRDIIRLKCLVV